MTVLCAHRGCRRTVDPHWQECSLHDGDTDPLVCICPVARPTPGWGNHCAHCGCPIVALNPTLTPYHHTYPQLAAQTITRPGTEQIA